MRKPKLIVTVIQPVAKTKLDSSGMIRIIKDVHFVTYKIPYKRLD